MIEDRGRCPHCNVDLNGGLIWTTFYDKAVEDGCTMAEAVDIANETAAMYGASQDKGMWGRQIGIYDLERDRTVRWKCPDCDGEWDR